MQAPAVMFIEMAADILKEPHKTDALEWILQHQLKELNAMGDPRLEAIGASGMTKDLEVGYQLGLQVARVMIAGSPAIMKAGIKPEDIL